MSRKKLRTTNTDTENLVANLRGEVGEIVTSWVLMQRYIRAARQINSGDEEKDSQNPSLNAMYIISTKLEDEIVARLSEISEHKIGRLNFYFASQKLKALHGEIDAFTKFVVKGRIRQKRNQQISHKEFPEKRSERCPILIPYPVLLRAIAMALRVMKRIDRKSLGPCAPYLWREARKRRYQPLLISPSASYMLMPYLNLSERDRVAILQEEIREGVDAWAATDTTINGQPTKIQICKRWGIILLGDRLIALGRYPLVSLAGIQFGEISADGPLTRPNSV